MRRYLTIGTLLFMLIMAGCGNNMTEEETKKAWRSTQQTLASGDSQAQAKVSTSDDGSSTQTTVDYTCPQGGSASFEGTYSASSSGEGSGSTDTFEADMNIQYNSCESSNITINGNLNYNVTTESTGDSASLVYKMSGNLDYSGEVKGSCKIDMTGKLSVNSSRAGWSYSGTACGHDAEQTLGGSGSINYDF
ncbi:MAG: hypothetical protein ABEN55_07635 [Bradymonadaceae bacterium]